MAGEGASGDLVVASHAPPRRDTGGGCRGEWPGWTRMPMGELGEGSTASRRMGRPPMLRRALVRRRRRFTCLWNAPRNPLRNARLSNQRIASGVRSFGGTVCLRPSSSS
uniref:Uncharacterized protein n=1 Tax=Oryza glumipatula TaxID=40148 RepID=A0A0D9Z5J2_9ORYZ